MIGDEITEKIELNSFSTTLNTISKTMNPHQAHIQPWNIDIKHAFKTQFSLKIDRLETLENRNSSRKRSMDQRIVQMYRKYSNEGPLVENSKQGMLNSRQIYRQKLKQFQNGSQFRRMGSKRQKQTSEVQTSKRKQPEELSFRRANVYCCDYIEFKTNLQAEKKMKSEYKCNDKFQRMLKIKDKLRKKNNLTVSKQKQKYYNQYQPQVLCPQKEINYVVMAKATIQRNKIKIKMRGLSKEDHKRKREFSNQLNNQIEILGCQSYNAQSKIPKQELMLNDKRWKKIDRDPIIDKLSQTLPYFNR